TFTLSDGGAGGVFDPATPVGAGSAPIPFTYTPTGPGGAWITVANDGGLVDPAPFGFLAWVRGSALPIPVLDPEDPWPSVEGEVTSRAAVRGTVAGPLSGIVTLDYRISGPADTRTADLFFTIDGKTVAQKPWAGVEAQPDWGTAEATGSVALDTTTL